MRTLAKFSFSLLVFCTLVFNTFSQVTATSGAAITATVVKQVGVTKTVDSEYGNGAIILTGTVKLTPVKTQTKNGNIVLPVSSGTFTATTYYFTGTQGYTYTVLYPASPMIIDNGAEPLQVDSFASEPARDAGSDLIAGVFISVTPANVTISYN